MSDENFYVDNNFFIPREDIFSAFLNANGDSNNKFSENMYKYKIYFMIELT
jgi:hypothetical protein